MIGCLGSLAASIRFLDAVYPLPLGALDGFPVSLLVLRADGQLAVRGYLARGQNCARSGPQGRFSR